MQSNDRETFERTYQWASDWQELPWSHPQPTLFLPEIHARRGPGVALDLGCGTGTDSIWLAGQGWQVIAVDFVARALELARQRAEAAGVSIGFVEADVCEWSPTGRFDLVLDHGLLHNLDPARHAGYRRVVLEALAAEGEFVLLHWHPLFPGQSDGRVGPRRATRATIRRFFAPELEECWFAREDHQDLPEMVGGGMSQAVYRFRRNPAHDRPSDLLDEVHRTLERHRIQPAAAAAVDDAVLARIVGPGRLVLTPCPLDDAAPQAVIADWSGRHGLDAARVTELLHALGDPERGGICTANPRCSECEVRLCRRMRAR